jgi:hypothetical protein
MTTKSFALISVIGFAGVCIAQAQSPTPGESPAQSPTPAKHRAVTKAQATVSPAASPAVSPKAKRAAKKPQATAAGHPTPSPSPGKFNLGDLFKPKTSAAAASPAAASPAPARGANAKAATNPPAPGGGHGLVWVNTETHVYHKEGSRFYGTTKKGKYMSEADAIKEGDKAARGHE